MNVKIRYNTLATDTDVLRWRVIIDEVEYLVENVHINVPTFTTVDTVYDAIRNEHVTKYHISCVCSSFSMKNNILTLL
jgi:hypothetical protein